MICKKCGQEVTKGAVVCPNCGCKIKKPIYKKWWFWVVIVFVLICIGAAAGSDDEVSNENTTKSTSTIQDSKSTASNSKSEDITYETIDLRTMVDDLNDNALKAEQTYKNKYVEITGQISNFDSDGKYISIDPVDKDAFDFTNITCYIKSKEQKEKLLNMSKGDQITIRGKIFSIGELLGYSINIIEVE